MYFEKICNSTIISKFGSLLLGFPVMRPSIRNYFERNKKTAGDENDKIALSQNGIKKKRKTKHACVSRLLKKMQRAISEEDSRAGGKNTPRSA